jgi:hypothetical protein
MVVVGSEIEWKIGVGSWGVVDVGVHVVGGEEEEEEEEWETYLMPLSVVC